MSIPVIQVYAKWSINWFWSNILILENISSQTRVWNCLKLLVMCLYVSWLCLNILDQYEFCRMWVPCKCGISWIFQRKYSNKEDVHRQIPYFSAIENKLVYYNRLSKKYVHRARREGLVGNGINRTWSVWSVEEN